MSATGLTFTKACDIKTCSAKCAFKVMLESAVYCYDKDNGPTCDNHAGYTLAILL